MNGERIASRITSEEKSTLSSYIGLGIAVVLAAGAVYFFLLSHEEKKEITTFDPNRPVPDDVTLRRRLKPEHYRVVRENGTETAFQNEFWNNERAGIYVALLRFPPSSRLSRWTMTLPTTRSGHHAHLRELDGTIKSGRVASRGSSVENG